LAGDGVVFYSRRRRYWTDAGKGDGIVALSPAQNSSRGKQEGGNSAKKLSPDVASTQKRTLKTKLKISRRTGAARKDPPQVFHGLKQWVGLRADGR
jgi:hypothetical protein